MCDCVALDLTEVPKSKSYSICKSLGYFGFRVVFEIWVTFVCRSESQKRIIFEGRFCFCGSCSEENSGWHNQHGPTSTAKAPTCTTTSSTCNWCLCWPDSQGIYIYNVTVVLLLLIDLMIITTTFMDILNLFPRKTQRWGGS